MQSIPLSDYGVEWFKDVIEQISTWFRRQLTDSYQTLSTELFGTPLPDGSGVDVVFGAPLPGDSPWYGIYQTLIGGEIMVLALIGLFLSVQGRHFLRLFQMGSPQLDRRTRRSAWTGGALIVAWYWVGVLTLYFVQGLTIGLLPNVTAIGSSMVKMLPVAALNPLMTLFFMGLGALALTLLKAIFFLRELLLYVYLYGMPIGIAFAFSNLPVVSQIAARFCRQFIPLALLPLPAAVLFRGYALLFGGEPVISPSTALFQYVTVISLPLVGLYLTWKTFRYAAPLVTGALARTGNAATTIGLVAGVGATAGASAAATTARFGPRAGMTHAAIQHVRSGDEHGRQRSSSTTGQDNVASDASDGGGIPAYRRAENDPGYY